MQAYELWKSVWSQTFLELDGQGHVVSDDFTRQDEIVVLCHGPRPVGLVFHRFASALQEATFEDSYFRCWTPAAIAQLRGAGPGLVIGSNITLHPEYRRGLVQTLPLKRLLAMASLEHLSRLEGIDAVTGTMRVDKGMHDLFYECGAFSLEKNLLFHNVPVDLVGFFPRQRPIQIPERDFRLIQEFKRNDITKGRFNEGQRSA